MDATARAVGHSRAVQAVPAASYAWLLAPTALSDFSGRPGRAAEGLSDHERAARLSRIVEYEALFAGCYYRGAEHQRLAARQFAAALALVAWADSCDPLEFTPDQRLRLALLCSHLANCLWTVPRRFNPPLVQRVVRAGLRLAGTVWEQHPRPAAEALSGLIHSHHIDGTLAWYDPDQRVTPSALRAVLDRFALAGSFATAAGSESGLRQAALQLNRQVVYLAGSNDLRAARRLNAQARERLNPLDPLQLEAHLLSTALLLRRGQQPRLAAHRLIERAEVLRGLPERLPHFEAGNTFLLAQVMPNWVAEEEQRAAVETAASSWFRFVVGSDVKRAASVAAAQVGRLGLERAKDINRRATLLGEIKQASFVIVTDVNIKQDRHLASEQLELKQLNPPKQAIHPFVSHLREQMRWAEAASGRPKTEIGRLMKPDSLDPRDYVHNLYGAVSEPGVLRVARFAVATGLQLADLLILKGVAHARKLQIADPPLIDIDTLHARMAQAQKADGISSTDLGRALKPDNPKPYLVGRYFVSRGSDHSILTAHQFAAVVNTTLSELVRLPLPHA